MISRGSEVLPILILPRRRRITMARPKTREDVELAGIKADLERARIKSRTILGGLAISASVLCVWIVARAAVQITDKPAWLVFALALLGSGGPPSIVVWRLYLRVNRLSEEIRTLSSNKLSAKDEASRRARGESSS